MKLERALGVDAFLKLKIPVYDFTGAWLEAFGKPERGGFWIAWGDSQHGKSAFALQLAKYMTMFGKVLYNNLEDGASAAMQNAFRREGLAQVANKLQLVSEPLENFDRRLKNNNSAPFAVIDSLQYTGLTRKKYMDEYRKAHPNKTILFVSQGTAKEPDGALGRAVKFDAKLKICIDRFIAYNNGRSQGTTNRYIVNEQKALELN